MADKILVVEDDTNLLETVKYNLRKEGYTIISAADGEQAIEIARRKNPTSLSWTSCCPG